MVVQTKSHWEVGFDARVSHFLSEYIFFVEKKYLFQSCEYRKRVTGLNFSQRRCIQTKVTNKSIPTPSLHLAFGSTQGQVSSKEHYSDPRTTSDTLSTN
jgi:hypothetical protein